MSKIEFTDTINFVETSQPDIVAKYIDEKNKEIAELKKQLHTQPKEIVERIKDLAEKMPYSPTEDMWLVGKSDFEQILKEYGGEE